MKMLTVIDGVESYQVKLEVKARQIVFISVLNVDQSKGLWNEYHQFDIEKPCIDFVNEFSKSDAKKVVKRYLRYK